MTATIHQLRPAAGPDPRAEEWLKWMQPAITALFDAKKWQEAMNLCDIALNLNPTHHVGHIWSGIALRGLDQFDECEKALRRALQLDPGNAIAMANLGAVIHDTKPAEAVELLRAALDKDPGSDFIAQNYMITVLSMGDYERGWNLYNRRTRFPAVGNQICKYDTLAHWDGKTPSHVLLVGEEGIGERIMFASMVPDVIRRGSIPVIEVTSGFERFLPWFKRSFPQLKMAAGGATVSVDTKLNIGDLGGMFRRRVEDFPRHTGYMTWDKERAGEYRRRLSPGPVVGVSYKSISNAGPHKTIPLKQWGSIFKNREACFVDLQYAGTEDERNAGAPLMTHLSDLDLAMDMDGLAALIGACDVVVTVSSVTAHMAGAMGIPCLAFIPCRAGRMWFWGIEGATSPWYPSLTLFRQDAKGDWTAAIAAAAVELTRLISG